MRLLFLEVETTGLIKYKYGIIRLDYLIYDSDTIDKGFFEMNPRDYRPAINNNALKANGYTRDKIESFKDSKDVCKEFINILNRNYSGKRYIPVSFNLEFTLGFIQMWLEKFSPGTYSKLISYSDISLLPIFKMLKHLNKMPGFDLLNRQALSKKLGMDTLSKVEQTKEFYNLIKCSLDTSSALYGGSNDTTM